MNDKPFANVSFAMHSGPSGNLESADFQGESNTYHPSTVQNNEIYDQVPYQQQQHHYTTSSGFQRSPHFPNRQTSNSMVGHRSNQSNVRAISSDRTLLGDTMRDNMGYTGIPNVFQATHVGAEVIGGSASPSTYSHFGSGEMLPSSMDDQRPSPPHRHRYPLSRPGSQQGTVLSRKMTDAQYSSMQLHASTDYYPSSFSQGMSYSTGHVQSQAEPPSVQINGQVMGPFSHDHRSAENSPPHATYPTLAVTGEKLTSNGTLFASSHVVHRHPSHPFQQSNSSISMRKASSEWMTRNGLLSVSEHSTGNSHKCYPSTGDAIDAHLQDAFLGGEANASDLSHDANVFVDHPTTRIGSSSIPPLPKAASTPPAEHQFPQGPPPKKKKKSKMHACEICDKKFPRPSGLRTHMNTHNNARPYPCGFPGCNRTFGVRSNAKRHLRTHGVVPTPPGDSTADAYVVGFSTPVVAPTPSHQLHPDQEATEDENASRQRSSKAPFFKLRWMPPSLTSRTNASSLKSVSDIGEFSDDDEDGDEDEDLDSLTTISRRGTSRSLSDISVPHFPTASSSSSPATGSPDCPCSIPCSTNPCAATNMARLPTINYAERVPRSAMAGGHPSSQVDTSPSFQGSS